jgi:hypothetical protein
MSLWYRGLRVIGGALALYLVFKCGIPKDTLLFVQFVSHQLQEGRIENVQFLCFLTTGSVGLAIIFFDIILTSGLAIIKGPYRAAKLIIQIFKTRVPGTTIKPQLLEATVVSGKVFWLCIKTGCKLVGGLSAGSLSIFATDAYYQG